MNLPNFFSISYKFFRKSGFIRRNTIAQNEFGTNVCRLPHSWRKGHCLTPKRCLDRWSNAPFFCAYAKRCFYGLPDDFSFLAVLLCRKRKVNAECVSLPHEWNRRPHTAGQTGKNDCCHPAEQVPSDRKQSYFLCCGLPFSRFRWCLFPFGDSFFYGFSPEVFFYTICLCFRLPPFCAFQ